MTLIRKMAGAGAIFAVAAMLFASAASAQPASMQVWGLTGEGDVAEGDEIEVFVDGESVGTATASADGWELTIQDGDADAEVTFTINGEAATAGDAVAYTALDSVGPITLTAGEATDGEGEGETPDPAETGNAGLLGGGAGTSMALVLALGVFAAALVAGGRTATRRS